ncbi:MAG: hypothetical protein ACOYEV_07365 [Candidatus Nanopelagicales bacterium]
MAWPTRFLAVPTGQLKQDDQVRPSPKASADQMRAYMAQVPAVYEKLQAGTDATGFQQMRASRNAQTRAVGEAYHHLFSPAGIDHRIEAEVIEGEGLVVTRGRHRVEAARELGLPYLPVHVRATDDRTLDASTRNFEVALESTDPHVVSAHRKLDGAHQAARSMRERTEARASISPEDMARASRSVSPSPDRSPAGPTRGRSR